jgi:hypothetical protein
MRPWVPFVVVMVAVVGTLAVLWWVLRRGL